MDHFQRRVARRRAVLRERERARDGGIEDQTSAGLHALQPVCVPGRLHHQSAIW